MQVMELVIETIRATTIPEEFRDILPIKVSKSPWFYPPT
jgi:hypothetical protein